jgi:hypothetical protein
MRGHRDDALMPTVRGLALADDSRALVSIHPGSWQSMSTRSNGRLTTHRARPARGGNRHLASTCLSIALATMTFTVLDEDVCLEPSLVIGARAGTLLRARRKS